MSTTRVSRTRQSGTVLIVAIVLLLVLTVLLLFGVRVGVFEQRISGNDFRSKLVHQAATAGLDHAIEYVKLNIGLVTYGAGDVPDIAKWELCSASDETFPCGSVPAGNRARMYRFKAGIDRNGTGGIDNFEKYMLPATQAFTTSGPFPVNYGVGAVLCTLDEDSDCTATASARTGRSAITLVSRAEITGEDARTTVSKTVGSFSLFGVPDSVPPIVAAGIVSGLGTSRLVPNADAGGPGVPVSVWSRHTISGGMGAWKTCHPQDYFSSCPSTSIDSGVVLCATVGGMPNPCKSISNGVGAGMGTAVTGIDLLDPTRTVNMTSTEGVTYLPSTYFPCDLFEYIFQIRAREDIDADGYCEGVVDDAAERTEHIDDFLEQYATLIPDCTSTYLNSSSKGLLWRKGACDLPGNQVGTPANPVLLVAEGAITGSGGMKYFGLIFVRYPFAYINPAGISGYGWGAGGGTSEVYGAVVMEGGATINGNVDIVYSGQVLKNINKNPSNIAVGNVTGTWTDRDSY